MTRYRLWSLLSLVVVLMLSLAACSQFDSPPTELSTQAYTQRLSGFGAKADFADSSECGYSHVWLLVSEVKSQSTGSKSEVIPYLDLYFSQYDYCTGEGFGGDYFGPIDLAAFDVDNKLNSATLNTSVEGNNWSGGTIEVAVNLTWSGQGDITREAIHRHYKVGDLIINEHISGQSRDASAFGRVMLGSTNLTPSLTQNAYLVEAKIGTVTIQKGSADAYPVIQNFTADPQIIIPGESSTLTWQIISKGKTTLKIEPDVGDVSKLSGVMVSPTTTTTYMLTATNRYGSSQAWVTVWVLTDDLYEPNNTYGQATPIDLNFYSPELTITRNDVDWFTFELTEPTSVMVNLGTWNFQPGMALFDSSQIKLAEGNYSIWTELEAGRYYLAISGAGDSAFNGTHNQTGFYYFSVEPMIIP